MVSAEPFVLLSSGIEKEVDLIDFRMVIVIVSTTKRAEKKKRSWKVICHEMPTYWEQRKWYLCKWGDGASCWEGKTGFGQVLFKNLGPYARACCTK